MGDKTLIGFLRAGLIDVGGNDAKLALLEEAVVDLADILTSTPSKVLPFALVAFDPNAPANDPVIKEVADTVEARWATYVNTFSTTPVALFRGLLLAALVRAATDEDRIGVAFVASARNVLPRMEVGAEGPIWADAVRDIEQKVDKRAEAEWATPASIQASTVTYEPPETIKVTAGDAEFDMAKLTKEILAATGPQNGAGQATGGNPHWPNSQPHWAQEFATRLAGVIIATVETSGRASAPSIDLSAPLQHLYRTVVIQVDGMLKAVSDATTGLQRRTNLIWWKEALFSPSARISYRELPPSCAAALMAYDLHCQVPLFSPASVSAFLHESVLRLPSLNGQARFPISRLLQEARDAGDLAPLRAAAAESAAMRLGRGPVLAFLGEQPSRTAPDETEFRARTGVSAATELTIPQWATWLFREMQAIRASREAADRKRRGRKTK